MVRRVTKNRIVAVGISVSLLALIIFVLTPPAMAVSLDPGTPSGNVTNGNAVTFSNVNFTIRNAERIIVNYLQFTIYKSSDDSQVAYVRFRIDGTETTDSPSGKFTVTNTTDCSNLPYYSGGSSYGYDELTGWNASTYGYGYGYNGTGLLDLTILYTIVYTTHTTGTFYAKLLVNSSVHDYVSDSSSTFRVTSSSSGGTVTPGDDDDEEEEEDEETTTSDANINDINEDYGLDLDEPFYGSDSDGDGVVDTFTDPNGVLKKVKDTTIDGNPAFLISTDDDEIPEFFWDPVDDTVTPITHAPPTSTTSETDHTAETITVTVTVTKESGWIYIDVNDEYPDYALTVRNADGEEISSDKIFREGGKIYVLDDPDETYQFIYNFLLLPPTFTPVTGTTFEVAKPTITITYTEEVTIKQASINGANIVLITEDHKIFTYTPETDLTDGDYTLSITVEDAQGNELTSTQTFSIDLPDVEPEPEPGEGLPLWPIIIIVVILIIILIIVFLFKSGYLYIEEVEEEEEEPEPEKKPKETSKKEKEEPKEKPEKKETKSKSKKTKKK